MGRLDLNPQEFSDRRAAAGSQSGKRIRSDNGAADWPPPTSGPIGAASRAAWPREGRSQRRQALAKIAAALGVSEKYLAEGHAGDAVADEKSRPSNLDSMAKFVQDAKARIAEMTGFDLTRVKLRVEFSSE